MNIYGAIIFRNERLLYITVSVQLHLLGLALVKGVDVPATHLQATVPQVAVPQSMRSFAPPAQSVCLEPHTVTVAGTERQFSAHENAYFRLTRGPTRLWPADSTATLGLVSLYGCLRKWLFT